MEATRQTPSTFQLWLSGAAAHTVLPEGVPGSGPCSPKRCRCVVGGHLHSCLSSPFPCGKESSNKP